MHKSLAQLHRALAALAPPSRFQLALELLAGERCVTDLADSVRLSQSCTTRHLQAMARAGIASRRRAGKRVMFRLEPASDGVLALIAAAAPASAVAPATPPAPASQRVATAPAKRVRAPARSATLQRGATARTPVRREGGESDTSTGVEPRVQPSRYRRPDDLEDFLL